MKAYSIPRPIVFLLDRNVVALIKHAVAGGRQHDARKLAYLDRLRALDVPENSMSPILSIMEGEKGCVEAEFRSLVNERIQETLRMNMTTGEQ
ncbi:hypothetical protein [Burkholderia cenocepacia]|uniref:hypothetical protein n=1 Tax=Burkholderia cenocepacia TaxID=95486 RepID=UPI00285CC55F|nr:hypothetical protein [Burkholderia cenocepacia]MDR8032101.1 hypothetical protein [Burkholderia cenocepacia]